MSPQTIPRKCLPAGASILAAALLLLGFLPCSLAQMQPADREVYLKLVLADTSVGYYVALKVQGARKGPVKILATQNALLYRYLHDSRHWRFDQYIARITKHITTGAPLLLPGKEFADPGALPSPAECSYGGYTADSLNTMLRRCHRSDPGYPCIIAALFGKNVLLVQSEADVLPARQPAR